jgi:hypothetical protein
MDDLQRPGLDDVVMGEREARDESETGRERGDADEGKHSNLQTLTS